MNLRQLRIFVEVCKHKSFTAASKALYMTQPAISHVIHDLENEVGTALFERTPKNIILTSAGSLLMEKAKHLLSVFDDLEKDIAKFDELSPLRIGSCITVAHLFLIDLIDSMKKEFPDIMLPVTIASASAILEKLENNEIDIAFIEGAFPQEKFNSIPLSSYQIIPVCAPAYIASAAITIEELISKPLLLREKGSAIRDVFDSTLLLHNIEIQPLWTSVNSNVLMKAAMQGMGIALLPENIIAEKVKQGALKKLIVKDLELRNVNYLIFNKYKQLTKPMQSLILKAEALCGNN
ncbi:LysR family transcriptional regulator [Dielma fastidiosa]|uniref:LysR family transcriptional regulator n=1 Tax=Dielma fastidiosa TaxID=1034346 RepID=UPI0015FD428E|nr:LysR family transcriptional regulator [Dielma fastidiosa]